MFRVLLPIVVTACLSTPALAQSRVEKIQALMEAQGLVQTLEQQLSSGREYGRKQAGDMLQQVLAGLDPTPEYRARFESEAEAFMEALQPPWAAKEIVEVWATYYGAPFSDEELDQLLAFYSSPLAQKEVGAGRQALVQWSAHFRERYQPIMKKATVDYVERLKLIARECKCSR